MVQTEKIAAVLHTLLALGALWILTFYCWRSQRLDALRDKLFELRHELFAMAERKEIRFEHPAYRLLRAQLNRMLARAHKLTGLMLLLRPPERINNDTRQRWIESLAMLPPETRRKLEEIEGRLGLAVIRHIVIGSPVAILILFSPRQPHQIIADEVARSIEALERIPTEDKDTLVATIG